MLKNLRSTEEVAELLKVPYHRASCETRFRRALTSRVSRHALLRCCMEPLIISTEMTAVGIARSSLAVTAGVHTAGLLKSNLGSLQSEKVQGVISNRELAGVKVVYLGGPSIAQIRAVAKRQQRRFGLPLLIIDLASKIRAPGKDDYERLTAVSAGIAQLKGELGTCIIAAVQINRAAQMNDKRRPELVNLKATGSWEEVADRVLLLHRPSYYGDMDNRTEIIQAKTGATETSVPLLLSTRWRRGNT